MDFITPNLHLLQEYNRTISPIAQEMYNHTINRILKHHYSSQARWEKGKYIAATLVGSSSAMFPENKYIQAGLILGGLGIIVSNLPKSKKQQPRDKFNLQRNVEYLKIQTKRFLEVQKWYEKAGYEPNKKVNRILTDNKASIEALLWRINRDEEVSLFLSN